MGFPWLRVGLSLLFQACTKEDQVNILKFNKQKKNYLSLLGSNLLKRKSSLCVVKESEVSILDLINGNNVCENV